MQENGTSLIQEDKELVQYQVIWEGQYLNLLFHVVLKKKKKMKVKIFVGDHVKELYETMYHEEDIKTYIGFCRCNAKKHSVVWYVHYIYGLLEDFVGPSSCIFKQSFFFFQYIVIARSNEIKSLEHLSEAIIDNDGLERIFLSKWKNHVLLFVILMSAFKWWI